LHVAFQRSGGRGEYEVVGSHSGYTAISLDGWTFNLTWPDGLVRETGLGLEPATSGKPRLRSILDAPFQIGRMIAAMLLLPDPRREYAGTADTLPILTNKGYVLARVGFGSATEFSPLIDLVTIDPSFVEVANEGHSASLGVEMRWRRIEAVYARIAELPPAVADAVARHRDFMASGAIITQALTTIVRGVGRALAESELQYDAQLDPLPALELLTDLPAPDGPSLPTPDRLGEDEPEVSARAAHQYRLARMRGLEARKFSLAVRQAYGHRCAFCGSVFGGIPGVLPGVDAAHILAWSKHDLDVLPNGISLCKLHHWAFDAAVLMPVVTGKGRYQLRFTTLAEKFEAASLNRLGTDGFELPDEWLPSDVSDRPSAKYLKLLYADLAVSFLP
jgi:hypothetical protein